MIEILFLLDNTISTLDTLSKGLIPNLSQGTCVVTGTSFNIPMILQIDRRTASDNPTVPTSIFATFGIELREGCELGVPIPSSYRWIGTPVPRSGAAGPRSGTTCR